MISIIIRTKNEESNLILLLESAFSQSIDNELEIVLIDSGSTDRTLDKAREYKVKVLEIPSDKFTYGYSLNYGIQNSSGNIICSISAHCLPCNKNWLSELVKPILAGKAHATFGKQTPKKDVNPFEELFLRQKFPESATISGRIPFSNANSAFLRKLWLETKFDEHITGWEDYLWYLIMKDKYIFKYVPKAEVFHSHEFSITKMAKTAYKDGLALRYIKEIYNIGVLGDKANLLGKVRYVFDDLITHAIFFLKKGYICSIFMLPFVKAYMYMNYWRGYNSFYEK